MSKDNKQCSFLDHYGWRCRCKSIKQINYHGHSEIYSNNTDYVRINVCKKHYEELPKGLIK